MTIYSQVTGNKIKTYLFIGLFMALIFSFFYLLGLYLGNSQTYFAIGLFISLLSALGSYFYSDRLVLAMAGAKPASKNEYFDYYTAGENMAIAAGLPMPRLFVIEDSAMNAFATGRDPKHAVVAATTGLLSKLDRAEVEGVIAHEISHIKNYDMLVSTIVAVLVGTLVFVADWVSRGLFWGGSDNNRKGNQITAVLFILFLLLTPILAMLIQLAISRRRELLADATGSLLNRNPDALANALIKISGDPHPLMRASNATAHLFIENPFKTDSGKSRRSFLAGLFSTHPPVEERVKILREM